MSDPQEQRAHPPETHFLPARELLAGRRSRISIRALTSVMPPEAWVSIIVMGRVALGLRPSDPQKNRQRGGGSREL
jgi:hypothetical protein